MDWVLVGIVIVVIFAIVAVVAVAIFILKPPQKQGKQATEFPYIKRDALFTPAERSFLGVLNQAVGENAQIFGKIRVADVIAMKKGLSPSDRQKAFNKISSKHFDFLLCDKNDFSVLGAIELNDSSHNSKRRKERDAFLRGACLSANVPLVEITARRTYSVSEIQNSIAAFLPTNIAPKSPHKPEASVIECQPTDREKLCPKCSAIMVKKIAKKGRHVGNEFWGCSTFPNCRHIEVTNT